MGFQEGNESEKKANFPRKLVFQKGDKVEVCSKEYGFIGSYYAATVVANSGDKCYRVKYKTLVEEDNESKPLEEVVMADEVRPRPPQPSREKADLGFDVLDRVDVFDNKGWWVGTVTEKRGEDEYRVYFETTADHIAYPKRKLRFHEDWIDDMWVNYHKKKRAFRADGKPVECKKRAWVDERVEDYKKVRIDGKLVDCKNKLRVSVVSLV